MSYSPKELLIFLGAIFQPVSLNFISILRFMCIRARAVAHISAFVPTQYFYFHWGFCIYIVKKSSKHMFLLTRRQFSSNKFLTWVSGRSQNICEKPLLTSSRLSVCRFSTWKNMTPSRCVFHKFCFWDFYYKFLNIFWFFKSLQI